MRKTLITGVSLASAAFVVVVASATFDLELTSVALAGVAAGAVAALVADRGALARLGGLLAGVAAAWLGYLVRAHSLPDTTVGIALTVALVLLACAAVAGVSRTRLPLWATLLGAGTFAGVYESVYVDMPPDVASTSFSTAFQLFATLTVGYLVGVLVGEDADPAPALTHHQHVDTEAVR
jgi:hypothetical protein